MRRVTPRWRRFICDECGRDVFIPLYFQVTFWCPVCETPLIFTKQIVEKVPPTAASIDWAWRDPQEPTEEVPDGR